MFKTNMKRSKHECEICLPAMGMKHTSSSMNKECKDVKIRQRGAATPYNANTIRQITNLWHYWYKKFIITVSTCKSPRVLELHGHLPWHPATAPQPMPNSVGLSDGVAMVSFVLIKCLLPKIVEKILRNLCSTLLLCRLCSTWYINPIWYPQHPV